MIDRGVQYRIMDGKAAVTSAVHKTISATAELPSLDHVLTPVSNALPFSDVRRAIRIEIAS